MPPTHPDALRGRDFLSLADLDSDAFLGVLRTSSELKEGWHAGDRPRLLAADPVDSDVDTANDQW